MSDKESRTVFLIRRNAEAVRDGRDNGYMGRLIESFADSFHSPQAMSDSVNYALAATLRIAELTGESFEAVLSSLDQPAVVRLPREDGSLVSVA